MKYFLFPHTRLTVKNWPYRNLFFHDLEIIIIIIIISFFFFFYSPKFIPSHNRTSLYYFVISPYNSIAKF